MNDKNFDVDFLLNTGDSNMVDDNIEAKIGNFQFNRQVAQHFDAHIRKSVPFYDEIHRMIVEMSDWFIYKNCIIYDLGTSTGEAIKNLWLRHRMYKNPKFIGIDNSKHMLEIARQKLKGMDNISLEYNDLNNGINIHDASLVLLLYVLQFVRPGKRQNLIQNIYDGLHDNGAMLLVEKVVGNNPMFNEMWIELYQDMKLRNGLTLEQIKAKAESLRSVAINYSQDKNAQLLEGAGFKYIDVFFKWYNFIGFIAVK
ncbi:MAG: methyltransferase domain-containing protein [Nitrososphaerales archaeon]